MPWAPACHPPVCRIPVPLSRCHAALSLKRKLLASLSPEFSPVDAAAVCKQLRAAGDKLAGDATIPVGNQGQRLPVVLYIVSAWTEIQRSGKAGANEAPTLSNGAPPSIIKLLDCVLQLGVEVSAIRWPRAT